MFFDYVPIIPFCISICFKKKFKPIISFITLFLCNL